MLSIEDPPPDPLCPSNLPTVKSHERASEKIAFQEAERLAVEENSTPNFSIRDYVLASRGKCVETSWPFSRQLLQRCLKHGLKDLLPPFEHPDLVRAQCLKSSTQSERPATIFCESNNILPVAGALDPRHVVSSGRNPANVNLESDLLLEEPIPNSSDPAKDSSSEARKLDEGIALHEPIHLDAKITSAVRPQRHRTEQTTDQNAIPTCSVDFSRSSSETPLELPSCQSRQNFEKLFKPPEKKCRLKVKLSVEISDINQADNSYLSISSTTASDSMASKVCPVCKTFSSTSNTTLNAHIDQCLFMDSNEKCALDKVPKVKFRQRKTKLMTEIYMTALHSTLEDLDRRNGTNWAVELAILATPTSGIANDQTKIPNVPTVETRDDRDANDVYVDSNGIKVKILSKFNNSSLVGENNIRKYTGVMKAGKSILKSKKKNFASKYLQKMKVNAQKNKPSINLLKNKFIVIPEGDHTLNNHQQDGASCNENQVMSSNAKFRQSVCSKRLDIHKKTPNKSRTITFGNTLSLNRSILAENNQSDVGMKNSKISRPSEILTGSLKMRRVDCLYNDHLPVNDAKRKSSELHVSNSGWSSKSASTSLLKLLETTCQPSDTNSVEIETGDQHESDKCCDMATRSSQSSPSSSREQAILTSKKTICLKRPFFHLEASKGETSERPPKNLKFRKQRSILRTSKRAPPYLLPVNGVHGIVGNVRLNIARKNRTVSSRHSCLLNNFTRSESKVSNQGSEPKNHECSGTMDEPENNSSNSLHSRSAGCHDTPTEGSDARIQFQNSPGPTEKAAADHPMAEDFMHSDNMETTLSAQSNSSPCTDDVESNSRSEVHLEPDQQQMVCDEMFCDDPNGQDILAVEGVDKAVQVSCAVQPSSESQAETASAQDSTGCVTSHGVHKSPSISSFITTENHGKYVAGNSGQSGLPLSPGSTISLPSSESSKLNDPEAESSQKAAFPVLEKMRSAYQTAERCTAEAEERNSGGRNEQTKEDVQVKLPDKSLDEKSFCCSCRESIAKDAQLARTTKANQVSNVFIGPRSSSSFNSYQHHPRPINMANSRMEPSAPRYPNLSSHGQPPQPQSQSNSNPVLRLMGKNLMVMSNEQLVQPRAIAPDHHNTPSGNPVPPGFASVNNLMKQAAQSHRRHPALGGPPSICQPLFTGNHQMVMSTPPLYSAWTMKPDQQTHPRKPCRRPNSRYAPYPMDEVIVIDDPRLDHETEFNGNGPSASTTSNSFRLAPSPLALRPFPCFPSESQTSSSISAGTGALFTNFHPMANATVMNRFINSEGQRPPLLPRPSFQLPTAAFYFNSQIL